MPSSFTDDHLPRRNARSLDLDDSAAKAAAWVWHLHTSKPGVTTEGRYISSQSRRRSSSNYDRKSTRFRQEASGTTNTMAGGNHKMETPVWDCGSSLYDTFELVAFGNRLDRSLMEVVPITPPKAHLQEHHRKSPLHEPSCILRTRSLPRSLSRQASKTSTEGVSPAGPSELKLSKPYNNNTRASLSGTVQKASTRTWRRVGKLMSVIKKVVVLHRQMSFMGCKRSTNVIESSQKPLAPVSGKIKDDHVFARGNPARVVNEKVNGAYTFSTSSYSGSEGIADAPLGQPSKTKLSFKLSISSKNSSNYVSDVGDVASMQKKTRACKSDSYGSGLLAKNARARSNSKGYRDGSMLENKPIWPRPSKHVSDDKSVLMDSRIKGGDTEGLNLKERLRGCNEHVEHYKHLHHHHHHHHHHHYLHHSLMSESARLSPETMSRICAEQSWLI